MENRTDRHATMSAGEDARGPIQVRVQLVGEFAVGRGVRDLGTTEVGSRKARMLLAFLSTEAGRAITVDHLVYVLWGDAPPREPTGNLAVLVSRLRATLGVDTIVGGRAGYRLGPAVTVDLVEAAHLVTEAESWLAVGSLDQALRPARRGLDLLSAGEVLQNEPDAEWADAARRRHAGLLRRARHATAAAALHGGDTWTSRAVAEAAIAADRTDETAARILMRAHNMAGEPVRAINAYWRLRTTLVEELGVEPAPSTRQLYLAVLEHREDQVMVRLAHQRDHPAA
jgi:DNA-binding SARP family transcriptional activator